jgi:hypothetical protein
MAVFRMFRVFRIRREVAAEGVSEVRSQVPLARGGPLADLLRLDLDPLQQRGQTARGQGLALGVVGPRPILERGQVANDGGRRQSVGRGGGEEVAQVGEEPHGRGSVRFDDGPGEGAGGGARESRPCAAGLIRDGQERAPVVGLPIVELLRDGGVCGPQRWQVIGNPDRECELGATGARTGRS